MTESPIERLTDRQRCGLLALWNSGSVDAAAQQLSISTSTLEKHLSQARRRLCVNSSYEAAAIVALATDGTGGTAAGGLSAIWRKAHPPAFPSPDWAEGARVRLTKTQRFTMIMQYAGMIALVVLLLVVTARLLQHFHSPVRH